MLGTGPPLLSDGSLNGSSQPVSSAPAIKTGAEEYAIEKVYVDQEFYIESTCGDVDFAGESAYFVGSFNDS